MQRRHCISGASDGTKGMMALGKPSEPVRDKPVSIWPQEGKSR